MKTSQINFVGAVIGQLTKVPQSQLTPEYIASLFADRLERRYSANFNRTEFLKQTGITLRMIEDAEAQIGKRDEQRAHTVEAATGPGGAWGDVPGVETVKPAVTTKSGHIRPFARTGSCR